MYVLYVDAWVWSKNTSLPKPDVPFTESPGLKVRMADDASILDFYRLFLNDEVMNLILLETNRYGAESIPNWDPINTNDLHRLFALVMLTGIIRKPTLKSYWTVDPKLSTPYFNSIMTRDKFLRILAALHFVDNTLPSTSRSNKIDPILKLLTKRFEAVYQPKKHIAIDETLLLYKGRLIFKQYIPNKRARFGMKGYVLAESDSGYIYKYSLYQGKDRENAANVDVSQGVAHRIVLDLMDGLLDSGYELIMDNWYNSPALMKELYERKTYAYGTLRSNRKHVPKDIKKKDPDTFLKKGECQYFTCDPVLTGCWVDRNFITFCSNKHSEFQLQELEKRARDGTPKYKPGPIMDYNLYMGGVDLADQYIKYYHMDRRTIKWYKKLFFHLVDMSVHNSYVIYKLQKDSPGLRSLKYRLQLIDEILHHTGPDPQCQGPLGRPRSIGTDLARLNSVGHYPSSNPVSEVTGKIKFRSCRVCNKANKRGAAPSRKRNETPHCCVKCGNIPLCASPCFEKWHTQAEL